MPRDLELSASPGHAGFAQRALDVGDQIFVSNWRGEIFTATGTGGSPSRLPRQSIARKHGRNTSGRSCG